MVVASDYLIPVLMSLVLLGMWFTGSSVELRERNQRGVISAIVSLAFANIAVELMNQMFFRPRPFADLEVALLFYQPTDSSFPSNPAVVGFATAMGVWVWNTRVGAILLGAATLFAIARVYAGVCYPLDVLGGAAIGVLVSLLVVMLLRWMKPLPDLLLRLARLLYMA